MGGLGIVLSRFTWELPQTMLGLAAGTIALLRMDVDSITYRDGVTVIRGWSDVKSWGGICFGTVILGDDRIASELNNRLYMHEYGHTLQSRSSGPIYLFKYGIPSLLSARGVGVHRLHPVERDANQRACAYFSQQAGFTCWNDDFNPLPKDGRCLPIHWWEYIPPMFPLHQLYLAILDRNGRSNG